MLGQLHGVENMGTLTSWKYVLDEAPAHSLARRFGHSHFA